MALHPASPPTPFAINHAALHTAIATTTTTTTFPTRLSTCHTARIHVEHRTRDSRPRGSLVHPATRRHRTTAHTGSPPVNHRESTARRHRRPARTRMAAVCPHHRLELSLAAACRRLLRIHAALTTAPLRGHPRASGFSAPRKRRRKRSTLRRPPCRRTARNRGCAHR